MGKRESHSPTGSVKDRVARSTIEDAEDRGALEPGQTVLERTSGNTGIALAMLCRRTGYALKVVMPDNVTRERTQVLRAYVAGLGTGGTLMGCGRRLKEVSPETLVVAAAIGELEADGTLERGAFW
jgi:cysteine synthase